MVTEFITVECKAVTGPVSINGERRKGILHYIKGSGGGGIKCKECVLLLKVLSEVVYRTELRT